jgi:hypothetical protein
MVRRAQGMPCTGARGARLVRDLRLLRSLAAKLGGLLPWRKLYPAVFLTKPTKHKPRDKNASAHRVEPVASMRTRKRVADLKRPRSPLRRQFREQRGQRGRPWRTTMLCWRNCEGPPCFYTLFILLLHRQLGCNARPSSTACSDCNPNLQVGRTGAICGSRRTTWVGRREVARRASVDGWGSHACRE